MADADTSRSYAEEREYTPQVRAALVAWDLAHGESLTTAQVAALTGLTHGGAWKLMCALAGALPIYQNECGCWEVTLLREIEGIMP